MYWINLIIFFGYTSFWFYFIDAALEGFIKSAIFSYTNLSSDECRAALRFAFACFLLNIFVKIRKSYASLRNFITNKTTNDISLTKMEPDRYKIDFIIDKSLHSIFIQKSTEYDNIEGIYTNDYNECVTNEVKPFFTFKADIVRPRDINTIYHTKDSCIIVTYKHKADRTFITDEETLVVSKTDYLKDEEKTLVVSETDYLNATTTPVSEL